MAYLYFSNIYISDLFCLFVLAETYSPVLRNRIGSGHPCLSPDFSSISVLNMLAFSKLRNWLSFLFSWVFLTVLVFNFLKGIFNIFSVIKLLFSWINY